MTATMEPLVDSLIEDARWEDIDLSHLANQTAMMVLTTLGMPQEGYEISLLGCGERRIAELNADFRGKAQPTNVLSWPSQERGAMLEGEEPEKPLPGPLGLPTELGDIALAWECCTQEALEQAKSMQDHVTHLLVHGILHLLGYDHVRDGDAKLMEAIEVRILSRLGIANPYEEGRPANNETTGRHNG